MNTDEKESCISARSIGKTFPVGLLLLALWGASLAPAQTTLVATDSVWKHLDTGTNLGTAWRAPGFNDGAWSSGAAQLGYGNGDETTLINGGPTGTLASADEKSILHFLSQAEVGYEIRCSTNLPNWFGAGTLTGTGDLLQWTNPVSGGPGRCFYRIAVIGP